MSNPSSEGSRKILALPKGEYVWVLYLIPPCIFALMFFWSFRSKPLWLDEFFTLALMGAPDIQRLWDGIFLGIDCNPPLYIVSSWIITNYIFSIFPPELVLRCANIALMLLTLVTTFKIMRRFTSPPASVTAMLMGTYGWNIVWPTQEVRHYALFLFVGSLAVLLCSGLSVAAGA